MSKIAIENLSMQISLCSEDVSVFQRMYANKHETVDWMLKFGSPLDRIIAEIIKMANEGKTGTWYLSANNTWKPVKYI